MNRGGLAVNTQNDSSLKRNSGFLAGQTDATPGGGRYSDLDHLAGRWIDDPEFDKAIEEMDVVDFHWVRSPDPGPS